jgi:two-component system, OmpR family, heavy metal sensor histidine kinase CusS
MFWKKDKTYHKGWSIIFRLTFLYTFSILLILSIISGILFFSLEESLHDSQKKFVRTEAALLNKLKMEPRQSIIRYLHDEKEETLEEYWKTLLTISGYGVLTSMLLGLFLAYRSMKPVRNITRAMQKMTITNLSDRLDAEKNWPKEFSSLAKHFNAMLDRLEISFNHLSEFSSNLAHELRTPINNLKGEAEICLMKSRNVDEYQQIIVSSLEEYDRLSRIIENILFLSRTEAVDNQLTYTVISVRQCILSLLEFYSPMAEEKSITLGCIGDEENKILLSADKGLFERVLHNLCSNALHYTPSGGNITIKISTEHKKILIQIIDTGIGINQKHIPYLFKRFYRTDAARANTSGGSGLGLAIVKSIMDLHHADIFIKSRENEGTTVNLKFSHSIIPD